MRPQGQHFDVVCFDCDSTLARIEGIDELAERAGVEHTVAPLTDAAMTGALSLDTVYAHRLSVVRPDRASIEWLGRRYVETLVTGAEETVRTLVQAGKTVHIVSGGLRQALLPLSRVLEVPASHIHAVDVFFDEDGAYRDFDRTSPLVRPHGKAEVCGEFLADGRAVALVGDGATDIAAREAGVFVVGFGGVAKRDAVMRDADIFVPGPELTAILDHLLTAP